MVFLRAVNVGGANRCRPALIAQQLARYGFINIGAVGTFVVRENVSEETLRAAIARKLPFKCEIMICPGHTVVALVGKDPFARQASGPDVTRFVMLLHKPLRGRVASDLLQISNIERQTSNDWLLKIVAIEGRFVVGLYRRQMQAIGYLGKIEKIMGVPATTRSWNTIDKIVKVLETQSLRESEPRNTRN